MNDSSEPYELTFEEREGYLYARVHADQIDRESALSYLRKVAARCREIKCERLVLARDIPVMLSDSDLFFTTNDFLKMTTGIRVAFVNPHSPIEEEMRFAILIGTNRGARFSVHSTLASAERAVFD